MKVVIAPIVYEAIWLLPCPGCGRRAFCECYPPPLRAYQKVAARVLPRSGETLYEALMDGSRSWPSR